MEASLDTEQGATRQLAAFASASNLDAMPVDLVQFGKALFLDNLACIYVGSWQKWAQIVSQFVADQGGRQEATVFGRPNKATASQAALVNGVMLGGLETEHFGHWAHPSGTTFPAALAIAESIKASGAETLTAMLTGYEVTCRIGEAQTGAVESVRGFHNPAANGPFGSAAAVGRLLRLDPGTMTNALGIAGSHCGGLTEYVWSGSMMKRLHLGRAVCLGLESACLAESGIYRTVNDSEGEEWLPARVLAPTKRGALRRFDRAMVSRRHDH